MQEISGLLMGKVRELRSAALVEINFTVCFKMFTGSWTVAFRDCHKVLREVVAKGLPSFQSEKWGPLGYLYYGWVIQKWGYDSGFWIVVYAWNNTSDCVTLIHIRDNFVHNDVLTVIFIVHDLLELQLKRWKDVCTVFVINYHIN